MIFTDYSGLNALEHKAFEEARNAMNRSYSPYSKFCVGATLYTKDYRFVSGTNVENASYGLTVCAERSAVVKAFSENIINVKGIAIIGKGEYFESEEITGPCGACRQSLYELAQVSGNGDMRILISSFSMEKVGVTSIGELLPFPFGPHNLGLGVIKDNP